MKISQKQASLLASEIVRQLKQKKVNKVSDEVREQLKEFKSIQKDLWKEKELAQDKIDKHDATLKSIVGVKVKRIYDTDSLDTIINKLEEQSAPSVTEIENEIILKSMFAEENDMQKFIDSIMSKYNRKSTSKVYSN